MVALTYCTIAAAILSTVWSAPVKYQKSTKVYQVSKGVRANGPKAYLKALQKHGGNSAKIAALQYIVASNVSADPVSNDLEYLSPITVGSQTFSMDFDTGSSDLWILGKSLASQASAGHTFYMPLAGDTAVVQKHETWQITYGDGSDASGNVYADTVTVGETTVTSQDVERATQASGSFLDGASDGIMGLAFDSLNSISPEPGSTFMSTAIAQGLPAVFTADLYKGAPGSYEFGAINAASYSGNIAYTSVDSSGGFWSFVPNGYSIGNTKGSSTSSGLSGIADTGTTLLLVDASIAATYWAKVKGAVDNDSQGGYIFPCSATNRLPSFTLNINGYAATVPGPFMNYAASGISGQCFGGLQSDAGIGFAVYGDIFLKSQFVVFDQSTPSAPQLGFANKAPSSSKKS